MLDFAPQISVRKEFYTGTVGSFYRGSQYTAFTPVPVPRQVHREAGASTHPARDMSALELNEGKPSGSEEPLPPEPAGAPASVESDSGAAGAASSEGDMDSCTLVAKWQGNLIELPVLPKSTTIGEVKASSR